jgi:probable HAF family extracellular repeat protein
MIRYSLIVAIGICVSNALADEPYFMGIGDLPGGDVYSVAHDISGNGKVVIGYSSSRRNAFDAFRWTKEEGIQWLDSFDGLTNAYSWGRAVNYDGTVIVGDAERKNGTVKGFWWTEETGMVDVGDLPGGQVYSASHAVSGDGLVVGGQSVSRQSHPKAEAMVWNEQDGMKPLGEAPREKWAPCLVDLNRDGTRGVATTGTVTLWESESGWRQLYEETGGQSLAISADGSTVVGWFTDTVDDRRTNRPFRWTEETGLVDLGFFDDGGWTGKAQDVSGDGSVIVGLSGKHTEPFIWDAKNGLRVLRDVMEEHGVDMSDWLHLTNCYGVSDDGKTIVGYGYHDGYGYEGWVAHIPEPSSALLLAAGTLVVACIRRR